MPPSPKPTNSALPDAFMIQGTGSNVGKSMLVAGLCRHFTNQGLTVRPFKPQNMSNNAAVTNDGGEIGRAQALQALACRTAPVVDMNPVLLKPEGETGSQVIIKGKRLGSYKARDFYQLKPTLMPAVLESFHTLQGEADLVIVEGAGSAAEVNLRQNDIANMGFALAANLPVYLAGDIDRGGVIAALIGTFHLLPENERALIRGFIINKFRGDPTLFDSAASLITEQTGWPSLGICPWFPAANRLPAEDSQDLASRAAQRVAITGAAAGSTVKIAVPVLPRISNFDDLDPLIAEPGVTLTMVTPGTAIPADTDLIILTGSKSTIADLEALYAEGWHIDIASHIRRGGHVLGICGGYQMLGRAITDPDHIEGPKSTIEGLGHLNVTTTISPRKQLEAVTARDARSGRPLTAYHMHMGETTGPACTNPLFEIAGQKEGAATPDRRITGTYLHGLFQDDSFRTDFLKSIAANHTSNTSYTAEVDETLDDLAAHLAAHLDLDRLYPQAARPAG